MKSRNEFMNHALKFYIGYLTSEKNRLAVEISKLSHVIAYSHGVNEEELKKLQVKCMDEVKRINGAVRFEDAYECI